MFPCVELVEGTKGSHFMKFGMETYTPITRKVPI